MYEWGGPLHLWRRAYVDKGDRLYCVSRDTTLDRVEKQYYLSEFYK